MYTLISRHALCPGCMYYLFQDFFEGYQAYQMCYFSRHAAPCRCFDVSSKIIYWVGGKTVGFLDTQVGIVVYNTPAWGLYIYILWVFKFFSTILGIWLRLLICVGWVETANQAFISEIFIDIRYKWDIIFDYSHTKWDSSPRSVPLNVYMALWGQVQLDRHSSRNVYAYEHDHVTDEKRSNGQNITIHHSQIVSQMCPWERVIFLDEL